jgi:HD-like signal output (HDOD) protein
VSSAANTDLDSWIQQLSNENMPVFSGTVTNVTTAINNKNTSASEVAQTILRDASLTSRLLKVANSFNYSPSGNKISTVSRAVMVLGFEQVSALTLTLALVDSLSEAVQRDKLTEEMAQSFHAAIQAQELAKKTGCKSPEEIFVATLLSRLGHMAFWAFSEKGTEVLKLVNTEHLSQSEAEEKVLGFKLQDLTVGLSKSWSLGELLDEFLCSEPDDDRRFQLISVGQELAQAANNGWDSDEVTLIFEQAAKKLDLSVDEVEELAYQNARSAKEITCLYGVPNVSKQIPQANSKLVDDKVSSEALIEEGDNTCETSSVAKEVDVDKEARFYEADGNVQLTIMQEISAAIEEKPSINIVLEMVLEGLQRGVGMDRALFAIISPDHKTLTCKFSVGDNNDRLCKELIIDLSNPENTFHQVVRNKKAIHVPGNPNELQGTLARETFHLLGSPPYVIMPVIVRTKVIGIFLADRNASSRDIEEKDFIAFQQFCQQANMGLSFLTM